MKIHPIITHNSLQNIFYILEFWNKQALVIDPCDAELCNNFLDENNLTLEKILITHEHADHYSAVSELDCHEIYASSIASASLPFHVSYEFKDDEEIFFEAWDVSLRVVDVPGHTPWHVMFEYIVHERVEALFVGDTLFAAWVGNVYSWNVNDLFESIQKFKKYRDQVVIYPGHDYLENNIQFTLKYFPELKLKAQEILQQKGDSVYFTNLLQERSINVFIHASEEEFIEWRRLRNTW